MKVRGIRGAITIEKDCEDDLRNATIELLNAIVRENEIDLEDVAYVQFSLTRDINCAYPAKFARKFCGFENVALMCVNEQHVESSLKMCMRVLVLLNTDKMQVEIKHQYLRGASVLRPDLIK